jgi:hypothetical protein
MWIDQEKEVSAGLAVFGSSLFFDTLMPPIAAWRSLPLIRQEKERLANMAAKAA